MKLNTRCLSLALAVGPARAGVRLVGAFLCVDL
jgi:hypothetical protein